MKYRIMQKPVNKNNHCWRNCLWEPFDNKEEAEALLMQLERRNNSDEITEDGFEFRIVDENGNCINLGLPNKLEPSENKLQDGDKLTEDQIRIEKLCNDIKNLLIEKNHDYGSSFRNSNPFKDFKMSDGILIRLGDKIARMNGILNGKEIKVSESMRDTIMDMIGYLVILIMVLEDEAVE